MRTRSEKVGCLPLPLSPMPRLATTARIQSSLPSESDVDTFKWPFSFVLAQLAPVLSHLSQAAISLFSARFSAHPGVPRWPSDSTTPPRS